MSNIYVTRSELRNTPYNIPVSDADNIDLERLQDITKVIVDNVCGQDFEQEGTVSVPVEKRLDGNGKDTIFLPKRIISLEEIRIYYQSTNYTAYTADNFMLKDTWISWYVFSEAAESGRAAFQVENFTEGSYNIGVVGVWGYVSVPEPIKYLQGRMIQKILEGGSFAEKFKTAKIGDLNTTLMTDPDGDNITGDFELDCLIKQYRETLGYVVF